MNMTGTGGEQRPAFTTAEECRAWLANTPLTHPVQALAQMLRQLNLLNRLVLDAGERLSILELLRKPLLLVQKEGARRFVGKPLPLVPPEQAAFDAGQAVWQGCLAGYVRCIEAALAGNALAKAQLALLLQRALTTLAAAQLDICRAGFQPTPEHWRALHELYATAEQAGVAETAVGDVLRHGKAPSSPRAIYAEALLLHVASPHELPLRHLVWVARWARRWAAKVVVTATPPANEETAAALCVDLSSSEPVGYQDAGGPTARWLDTANLRQSLKRRLTLLDQGGQPADAQLGEDCAQPACGQVLKQIYQRWCRGGLVRRQQRHTADGRCEIICGVGAIHYYLSGRKPFRQPSHADDDALRREREEIATFGRVARSVPEGFSQQQGYQIEEWQVVDESAAGIHVARSPGQTGSRVAQGQLVAIRPPEARHFVLGTLRWAMVTVDAWLHTGILMMPGRAEPITVRATDPAATKEPYRAAFLLPAVESLATPASIIIPPGYFRVGRILEVSGGSVPRVRLLQLGDRGVDSDRATYEPAA